MSAFSGRGDVADSRAVYGKGAMARHRERKRHEARERQAAFDHEVRDCARRHNITEPEARRIVHANRLADYRKAQRKAGAR